MKLVFTILGVGVLALVLYLLAWPVPIQPVAWTPPTPVGLVGPYAPNTALAAVERVALPGCTGPEDVARGPEGRLYTGIDDGRIMRLWPDGRGIEEFANTGGRPLGMEFDAAGNLIVADAWRGLLSVNPAGEITVLSTGADGVPFKFTDDLHIASYGTIYFSDASDKFHYGQDITDILEHGGNGRLLAYVPARDETRVVLAGLQFANGVAMDPQERFVLVNETGAYRTKRVWLTGEKAGQVDTFIDNLPGFPDNITCNGDDTFWLALPSPRNPQVDEQLAPSPFLRKLIMRLPATVRPAPEHYGFVIGLDLDGNVTYNLQDDSAEGYAVITSVNEYDGRLYMGSLAEHAIAILPVPPRQEPGAAPAPPPLPKPEEPTPEPEVVVEDPAEPDVPVTVEEEEAAPAVVTPPPTDSAPGTSAVLDTSAETSTEATPTELIPRPGETARDGLTAAPETPVEPQAPEPEPPPLESPAEPGVDEPNA